MPNHLILHGTQTLADLNGQFDQVIIQGDAEISVLGTVNIEATGNIHIGGKLAVAAGNSVRIQSQNGPINVRGSITVANSGTESAGGNIMLRSDYGSLTISGSLSAGTGGDGRPAQFGGHGALGGNIELRGLAVFIRGQVKAGAGGNGGNGFHNELPVNLPEASPLPLPVPPEPQPPGPPVPPINIDIGPLVDPPPPPGPPGGFVGPTWGVDDIEGDEFGGRIALARARGGNGGAGGNVFIEAYYLEARSAAMIETGKGGDSGGASASGGVHSNAESGDPANGGQFEIVWRYAPTTPQIAGQACVTLGSGGRSLDAYAFGRDSAAAQCSSGGKSGIAVGPGADTLVRDPGRGGDSLIVHAEKAGGIVLEEPKRKAPDTRGGDGASLTV